MKYKISDGREIDINIYKISLEEYRAVITPKQKPEEEDAIMARVFGMSIEDYLKLPVPDWRFLTFKFFELARRPLADPNLASESTSTTDTESQPQTS